MRRRGFIALVGGAAATWPLIARAQQAERMRRIGVLMGGAEADPVWQAYVAAFREELAKLGWIEDRNLRIDLLFGDGDANRMSAHAAELVKLNAEVILTTSGAALQAVQRETGTIPIVAVGLRAGDSGASALAGSIARPKGNVTGFPILYGSIGGKWLELLKAVAPRVARVALIINPDVTAPLELTEPAKSTYAASIEAAAQALGVKAINLPFRDATELKRAIDDFAAEPNGGLIVSPSVATGTRDNRQLILSLATQHGLPTIHWDKAYPVEGGLMSYGSDMVDLHRRSASYVDRILRGAKVGDLPVQYPTKFDLVINPKTAKALGLTIPQSLIATADIVIE
jgi:putative tryptophan/tyrosine transport system substrate-binding protein